MHFSVARTGIGNHRKSVELFVIHRIRLSHHCFH
jgi:hypothetical protein